MKLDKEILAEALIGFILWTIFLTPYIILIIRTTLEQYLAWVLMQIVLVTPIAPLVFRFTKMIKKKIFKGKKNETNIHC